MSVLSRFDVHVIYAFIAEAVLKFWSRKGIKFFSLSLFNIKTKVVSNDKKVK